MSTALDTANTVLSRAVLRGTKSILTRGLESGIFRIHTHYGISTKKGKQHNISRLKYQCICTPYPRLIKTPNCSASIFQAVKQCFFLLYAFLIWNKNVSVHVLPVGDLNNFLIKSNFLLSQFALQYLPAQPVCLFLK